MPRYSSNSDSTGWVYVILFAIILLCGFGGSCAKAGTVETVTATVTDKTVKRSGETDKYLVFTDQETFENTDEWLAGKFNSSDVYGRIKVGKTYKFTVRGWRIPFFSSYRNITEAVEVQ